jgi:hypothetical protein
MQHMSFFRQLLTALARNSPAFSGVRYDALDRRRGSQLAIAVERSSPAFAGIDETTDAHVRVPVSW